MIPLVVVAGPTASGKTALSIELALRLGGEIVSADSMQLYRRMDIGTAKPTEEEKRGVIHHMMDFLEPSVSFSVADYCAMAAECIRGIHSRGRLPILVGGTGLYIDSLINGVDFGETNSDGAIRAELEALAASRGAEAVHSILAEIDPETAAKYHPNNLRRVIRAIEFYRVTGQTISAHAREEKSSPYRYAYFCIKHDRAALYERINRRVDLMLEDGLADEVRALLADGYSRGSTAMQGIGYKELFGYIDGEKSLSDAAEEIKTASRRYAKRQLTWFRRNENIHWLEFGENMADEAIKIIEEKGILKCI